MKYVGSKTRISKDISKILNEIIINNNINSYIEPFVGGSNMIEHIKCKNKYGYDNNEYLIEFWKRIQQGWNPLTDIVMTKDLYNKVKTNKDDYPKHIVALCGLCATYNAKWFGGYAGVVKTKTGIERNYYEEAVRNVLKQRQYIMDVKYDCKSYKDIDPIGFCIYCDPPYENTIQYHNTFNHLEYWDWVRKISLNNFVLCSEYNAPDDFNCIWEKKITTTLDKNTRSIKTEKLFIYENGIANNININKFI